MTYYGDLCLACWDGFHPDKPSSSGCECPCHLLPQPGDGSIGAATDKFVAAAVFEQIEDGLKAAVAYEKERAEKVARAADRVFGDHKQLMERLAKE